MHDEVYCDDPEPLTTDMAWAIGLFEGEGCFSISHSKQSSGVYKQPRAFLGSTDEDVVRRFHRVVEVGRVLIDHAQERRGYKTQWKWLTSSRSDVEYVIGVFYSHLGMRRKLRAAQLLAAFEARDTPRGNRQPCGS